jgi:predicted acetyltransferase
MSVHNGPIDSEDPWWWTDRILGHWSPDDVHRVVVVRGPEGIEGYASFVQNATPGHLDIDFRLDCKQFLATTPDAYRALLVYVRGFAGVGQALRYTGPPDDPLSLFVEVQRLGIESNYRWMLRLLDVPAALSGRGYAPVSGDVTLEVDDPRFEENRGPWRVVASDGVVTAERASGDPDLTIDIRALSAMYTGYLSPFELARVGWLRPHERAVPFLASLFAGPAPFMLDFF